MADTNQTNEKFNFSPNTISAADYTTIKAERDDLLKKQLAANNEFMFQHYARLLREIDKSYERATKANIILERKVRREEAKKKRDGLKTSRKP
jgi:uncharacterized phage-like protein YoqJ